MENIPNSKNIIVSIKSLLAQAREADDTVILCQIHKELLDIKIDIEQFIFSNHVTSKLLEDLNKFIRDSEYYVKTKLKLMMQFHRLELDEFKSNTVSRSNKE